MNTWSGKKPGKEKDRKKNPQEPAGAEKEQIEFWKEKQSEGAGPIWEEMAKDLRLMEKAGIFIYIDKIRKSPEMAAQETMGEKNGHYTCSYGRDPEGKPGLFFERITENPPQEPKKDQEGSA